MHDTYYSMWAAGVTLGLYSIALGALFIRDALLKKTSRIITYLLLAAWTLFVISFFTPCYYAFGTFYGWQAAWMTLDYAWECFFPSPRSLYEVNFIGVVECFGSILANLAMLGSPFWVVFLQLKRRRKLIILAPIFSTLIAFIWMVQEYLESGNLNDMRIGYFAWLFSFALISVALILDYRQARPLPGAASATPPSASPASGPGRTSGCSSTSAA